MVYIYSGLLLSHKKEWNNAICTNMDGPRDYHPTWSKSNRERKISYDITYMWNLKKKMIKMNLFTKEKQTHRLREWIYGYRGEGWEGGIDWELGVDIYTLLYLK